MLLFRYIAKTRQDVAERGPPTVGDVTNLVRSFDAIDTNAKRAVDHPGNKTTLNWKSGKQISSFVSECMDAVNTCHTIFTKIKSNLKEIQETLDSWDQPLLQREERPQDLVEFNRTQKAAGTAQNKLIKEGTSHIHQLLKDAGGHP